MDNQCISKLIITSILPKYNAIAITEETNKAMSLTLPTLTQPCQSLNAYYYQNVI